MLTGSMRGLLALTIALAVGALSGCSLFGLGGEDRQVPQGDAWRAEVVEAIEGTPGVTSSSVVVQESDNGAGYSGPLLYGSIKVEGDAQAVVDDAMLRVSEVLGQESDGVRLNIYVSADGGPAEKLRQYGYDGVSDGAALWEATH